MSEKIYKKKEMKEKEREKERDGIEGRKNRRRSFEELRPSAFARVASRGM